MVTVTTGIKRRKLSESPPSSVSLSSLPNDVLLNILARVSRFRYPTLSLVSKTFQSLLSSRDLYATRTLIKKTENCFYVCFENKPRWFTVKHHKLIALPSFPYEHPESPSIVSAGSEIYIIGGYTSQRTSRERSRRVFVLDCRSHQWRRLPNMLFPRVNSTAGLIQGKIYVFGGCNTPSNKNWGEIYDPKTQSWELLSPTTFSPDIEFQKSIVSTDCFVEEEKIWCRISGPNKCLSWCDLEDNLEWRKVKGLKGFSKLGRLISVANSDGGRTVIVWFVNHIYNPISNRTGKFLYRRGIRCAKISFERRSREELFGIVKWSKMICNMNSVDVRTVSLLALCL